MDRPKWIRPLDIPAFHSDTHAYRIYGKRRLEELRVKLTAAYPSVRFQWDVSSVAIIDPELGSLGHIAYGDWFGDEFYWQIRTVEGKDDDDFLRRTRMALDSKPRTRVDLQMLSGWCPNEIWIRYTVAQGGEAHMIAAIDNFRNECSTGSER